MTTWFTSDTHFGHRNILKYCYRKFYNTHHMDIVLMYNWNSLIKPCDVVWHLGDFAFGNANNAKDIFSKLNGTKHLIKGNHDYKRTLKLGWESISQYKELTIDNVRLILMHYPMEDWDNRPRDSIHLHGHAHGQSAKVTNRFDVGVDANELKPVTLQQLLGD